MSRLVDARGLACPQPVILTRKAMEESADVTTVVNSVSSRDNVRRMAEKAGCDVTVEPDGADYYLHIRRAGTVAEEPEAAVGAPPAAAGGPLVLVISEDRMGRGSPELGGILMRSFFHTLGEIEPRPDVIIFFNAGVWLVAADSPVLEDLCSLEASGISLLVCGTCLDYFELRDRLAVGRVSNMYEIAETMLSAGKVVML
jgi:selenium metabolism protein YedF